jgi:hypothetical protein
MTSVSELKVKAIRLRHEIDSCRERVRHIEFLCRIEPGEMESHLTDLHKASDKLRFLRKELCEVEVQIEGQMAVQATRKVS